MQYEIERFNTPAFFTWLSSLGPHQTGATHIFNNALVCGYAAFDVLETWMDDREYLIPDLPDAPTLVVYFLTSEGKRVFAAFFYGHEQRALLAEITMLQLAMLPAGVRTVSGKHFQVPAQATICAPADGKPISRQFIGQPTSGAYMAMQEVDPLPKALEISEGDNLAPARRKWLRFDIGHPLLAASHINTHAGLLSLAQPNLGG